MMIDEKIKDIKKAFFTYRNGILADQLRNAGDKHTVIFGLNIPQLMNIANETGHNADVARELWNNSSSRESRMIAPMIFPYTEMSHDEACKWIESIENIEIADNLCHKLLKKLPSAEALFIKYSVSDNDLLRYTAFRLAMNLLCINAVSNYDTVLDAAKHELERNCNLTRKLCNDIIVSYIQSSSLTSSF